MLDLHVMYHIGMAHLPHTAPPFEESWYPHTIGSSKAPLKMDSSTSTNQTTHPSTDQVKSPTGDIKTTVSNSKSLEELKTPNKTDCTSCACSTSGSKSKTFPMPKVTIESGDDSDTSTGTVKVKKSSPHTDANDDTATIEVKKYNPIISKFNDKHRHTDPHPQTCNRQHVASYGLTGFSSLFEKDYPITEDTKSKENSPDPKVQPKPLTREAKVHISQSSNQLPKLVPHSAPPPPKTTYKSTLPLAQNTTFQISTTETRSSLMLSTLDLLARYDNHFHRTEYSNSLLRHAKEDSERKIEELEWRVRCFAKEEGENRKDMCVLEKKFRDVQDKLRGEKERVKGLEGDIKEGKELKERLDDRYEELQDREVFFGGIGEERVEKLNERIEELEGDLKGMKSELTNADDENSGLREKVRVLEGDIATLREEHKGEINDYRSDVNKYLNDMYEHSLEKVKLDGNISTQKESLQKLMESLEQKNEEGTAKDETIRELQDEVHETKRKFEILTSDLESLQKQLEASHELLSTTKNEHSFHDDQTKALQKQVFDSAAEFEKLTNTIEDQAEELETLRSGSKDEARIRILEEEIAGLKAINEDLVTERQDFMEKATELAKYADKLPPTPPKRVALGGLSENTINMKGKPRGGGFGGWTNKHQVVDAN